MNIAGLRIRVTFQKQETVIDQYGNHKSAWQDVFSCWATAVRSGKSAEETHEAGHTQEADRLDFTVRYSSETAAVTSRHYRIAFQDRLYNIVGIDEMGFRHTSRKFLCEEVSR